MTKYKFNPYERAVGLFLSVAVFGSLLVGITIAIKKNWFDEKIIFITYANSAANLRSGNSVLMAGLKVGKIEKIELDPVHNIKVTFSVWKEYRDQVKQGTRVQFIRPYIIGDKVLTLLNGRSLGQILAQGSALPLSDSLDLMDVLSSGKLESVIAKVDDILSNLDGALAAGKDLAIQVGEKKKLKKTMENLAFASGELRKVLPHLSSRAPEVSEQLGQIIKDLSYLTSSLREMHPDGAKKTIELMNESIITLQAMQRSFFLKSNVQEVKEELAERERAEKKERLPASVRP